MITASSLAVSFSHAALWSEPVEPDHVAALDLGDLGGHRAHRAGGGGDEHLLALLQPADLQEAAVGGHAGAAERVQIDAQGQAGIGVQDLDAAAVADKRLPHADTVADEIARVELVVVGGEHPSDASAGQRLVQTADRR